MISRRVWSEAPNAVETVRMRRNRHRLTNMALKALQASLNSVSVGVGIQNQKLTN